MPTSDVTHRETVGFLAQCLRASMLAGEEGRGQEGRGEVQRKGEERRKLRED